MVNARMSEARLLVRGGIFTTLLVVTLVLLWSAITPSSLRAKTVTPTPEVAAPEPARPVTVTSQVLNGKREPVVGASAVAGEREVRTDAEGRFTIEAPAGAKVLVKLPGFQKVTFAAAEAPAEVVLKPQVINAAYLTYYGFVERSIRNRVLDLAAKTELNAVVIDVKGDRGWILYRTEVPMAIAAGAQGPATVKNFDAMMADLKTRGIYTIARVVTFKDNILANHRPELAVIDTRTGKPWLDRENLAWVDPFRTEVWDYNIAIAEEAIRKGFDEVQFDYVRFPTDGKLAAARYSRDVNRETRLPTIAAFLARARAKIGPLGGFVAADIFGYTAFNENDTDIGQRVEELAPHVDYLSPMVYPSGYHLGIPGYRNPVANPYQVVHESVRLIRKRSRGTVTVVRPWLQDFRDYAFDRRIFGVPEIRAQIKGSDDGGGIGWMLWNPRNDYTGAALREKVAAR
ncbi:MAG: GTP-binding protein [Candidatus Rokubacteria bacterium]|nr:GTP-binding protein [Candidatus Rokubacteria bacterium]